MTQTMQMARQSDRPLGKRGLEEGPASPQPWTSCWARTLWANLIEPYAVWPDHLDNVKAIDLTSRKAWKDSYEYCTLTNCCFKSNHCSFSLKIIYVARRLVWAVGGALRDKLPSPLLNCSLWRWTDLAMTSNTSPWRGNSSVSWRSSRIDESVTEPEGDSRSHALAYLLS